MDFYFTPKIRLGQGISQSVGLAAKECGARAILLTESIYESTKELTIITQALERASVPYVVLSKSNSQSLQAFVNEASLLGKAGHAEVLISMGNNQLISIGRWVVQEMGPDVPLIEVPTSICSPLLLREEAFLSSGHPSDLKFLDLPRRNKHRIFLDPHMTTGMTAKTSVSGMLTALFFAVEAYYFEALGVTEESLLWGAINSLWDHLKKVYENPANVASRLAVYQAGFNVSLALALLPRGTGLTLVYVLGGILELPNDTFGGLFLAPFLELYGPKELQRTKKLASAFGVNDWEGKDEELGPKLAQDVRKFLNNYQMPLRLSDFRILETQVVLAADAVKAMGLRRLGLLDSDKLNDFLDHIS